MRVSETSDILVIDEGFPLHLCGELIALYQSLGDCWKFRFGPRDGRLVDLGNKPFKEYWDNCYSAFQPSLALYRKHYNFYDRVLCGGFKLLEYREGEGCREHYDGFIADGEQVRIQSVVIYLNSEFESGEVVFPRQKQTIVPTPGKTIFFPPGATHPHSVVAPRGGSRYALITWLLLDTAKPGESLVAF